MMKTTCLDTFVLNTHSNLVCAAVDSEEHWPLLPSGHGILIFSSLFQYHAQNHGYHRLNRSLGLKV